MPDAKRPSKPAAKSPPAESTFRPAQLPPRVVKKKKPIRREAAAAERDNGPAAAPSELLIPIILIVVGLIGTTTTTIVFRPEGYPFVLWVVTRMILVVGSAVLTYGALFIAAQVLDTDYGYISTGALKVIALTLTQDWVGDVVAETHIPLLPWIAGIFVTYGLFMYFFDLDLRDAIASVVVVRIVHYLALTLLFALIMAGARSGQSIKVPVPGAPGAAVDADEEPDEEDPLDPNALGPGALPGR